jgi:hypothetical protein
LPSRNYIRKEVEWVDWAKLAAFIDGEGCISIKSQRPRGTKSRQHQIRITITNTDARLITWCSRVFGVGNSRWQQHRDNPKWKDAYRWEVTTRDAEWVLVNCLPHFILKRDQAEIALELHSDMNAYRAGPGELSRVSHQTLQKRDVLKNRLHVAKKKIHLLTEVA